MIAAFFALVEALWQPARKSAANENRRPIYVFSTDLANLAADAVLKNRYDSIIQFHNAQPKGPGFLCLSKKEEPKREANKKRSTSDSGNEEEVVRVPKRRFSRLSASDDAPTAKKLRSGGQAKGSRFSRRLRQQKEASSSPPSSPTSEHSSSDNSEPSPPVVVHRGRGSGRLGRGRRRGRGGRRNSSSLRNRRRGEIEGELEQDSAGDKEDEDQNGEREELDTSKDTDKHETAEDEEEQKNDSEHRPGSDYGERKQDHPRSPALNLTPQASSKQQPVVEGENNYTICHGIPHSKGNRTVDMSSPAPKPPPQTHQAKSTAASSPAAASAMMPPSQPTQHDIASLGVIDKGQKLQQMPAGVVSSGRDPMLAGQHPHPDFHKDATVAPNNWPGGLGPQFAPVPSGYYGAGIHPMHYTPHAAQHVPGANYSYGMYPWGAHTVGQPSRDQHPYVTHESLQQHARSSPASSQSGEIVGGRTSAATHVAYQHHPRGLHPSRPSDAVHGELGKEPGSSGAPQGHEAAVMKSTSSHEKHPTQPHPTHPHTSLHGPGAATTLAQVQHPAFSRPPHATLTTEQISAVHHQTAAPFPYGFDPNNPAALSHMLWQQQQHQIRAAGGVHPSHLPPHLQPAAAGMWYAAPHMQHLMQQQHGGGGTIPDDSAKRRAAMAAQQSQGNQQQVDVSAALRMNSNRNNNNSMQLHGANPSIVIPSLTQTVLSHGGSTEFAPQSLEWTAAHKTSHLSSSYPR